MVEESYEDWEKRQIEIFESRGWRHIDWDKIDLRERLFRIIVAINDLTSRDSQIVEKLESIIKKDEDLIAKQQKQIDMLIRELHPDADYVKELLGLEG